VTWSIQWGEVGQGGDIKLQAWESPSDELGSVIVLRDTMNGASEVLFCDTSATHDWSDPRMVCEYCGNSSLWWAWVALKQQESQS
jgi:hypothetical protein